MCGSWRLQVAVPCPGPRIRPRTDSISVTAQTPVGPGPGSRKVRGRNSESDSVERRILYVVLLLGWLRRTLRTKSALPKLSGRDPSCNTIGAHLGRLSSD
jgi:hypothetical protein